MRGRLPLGFKYKYRQDMLIGRGARKSYIGRGMSLFRVLETVVVVKKVNGNLPFIVDAFRWRCVLNRARRVNFEDFVETNGTGRSIRCFRLCTDRLLADGRVA